MNKIKQVFSKNKSTIFTVIGIISIICIAFGKYLPINMSKETQEDITEAVEKTYEEKTIEQLQNILSKVSGVGKIEIMLTLAEGYSYEYATETRKNVDTLEDISNKDNSRKQEKNTNEEKYVIVEKNGQKTPIITKQINPKIKGVIVVCDGGANPEVVGRVVEATSVALGILSSQISVLPMV